jgi:hypothetical protein
MYYFCLAKLSGIQLTSQLSLVEIKEALEQFKIPPYQYRIFSRLSFFMYKVYFTQKPPLLYMQILELVPGDRSRYNLRSSRPLLNVPFVKNKYSELNFQYIGSTFINKIFYSVDLGSNLNDFKGFITKKIDSVFLSFISVFKKFNCYTKHLSITNKQKKPFK